MLGATTMSSAEANHAVYERHAGVYDSRELQKPEQVLLKRFRGRWGDMVMLDIGVGSGRTAYTFSAITRRYVGIDYSRVMVELSRERIGEDETTRFLLCDARRLAEALDERFDLVLFSYNGLDSVGHDDRRMILSQVRAVLKDDGHFFFSSHSLASLPLRAARPKLDRLHPARLPGVVVLRPAGVSAEPAAGSWVLGRGGLRRLGRARRPAQPRPQPLVALPLHAAALRARSLGLRRSPNPEMVNAPVEGAALRSRCRVA
jgi:SAM-dependent methyltransferase